MIVAKPLNKLGLTMRTEANVSGKQAHESTEGVPRWRPIDTAPMDGTEIIGVFHRRYDEDGPATVYGPWTVAWDGRKWRSSWDGSEVISYMSDFGTEYKGPDIEPTHWMALPEPPKEIP